MVASMIIMSPGRSTLRCAPSGYWDENMVVTVSADRQSYSGTYARSFYDVNGNFLFEDDGTLTATRLSVEQD